MDAFNRFTHVFKRRGWKVERANNAIAAAAFVAALFATTSATAQTDEENARFAFEEAMERKQGGDFAACVKFLDRAEKYLGRPALRVQGPLVECLYSLEDFERVSTEASEYLAMVPAAAKDNDEYRRIGRLRLLALDKLDEQKKQAEALAAQETLKRAEAERKRLDKEAADAKMRQAIAKANAERRRKADQARARRAKQKADAETRQRMARESARQKEAERRERYLDEAPARRDAARERESAFFLDGVFDRGIATAWFGGGLALGVVGIAAAATTVAGLGGVGIGATAGQSITTLGGVLFAAAGGLVTGLSIFGAYWLLFEWGPDAWNRAEANFNTSESFKAEADREQLLIDQRFRDAE